MLGIIISIIATAIISILIARWQMKKNKIIHFSINSYDIGKGLSDEFPEFKLHYGGEDLTGNVKVLKGGFMNIGKKDINGLKGENDIKLILPEECNIKAYTISSSVEELKVTAKKDEDKENILNIGIANYIKTDEFFKYTAIVETSGEIRSLYDKIKFQHRILNTEKIRNIYIGQQSIFYTRKGFYKWIMGVYFILCIFGLVISLYQTMDFKVYHNSTNKEVKLNIDPKSNIYVTEGISIPFLSGAKISSNDLDKDYRIVPVTEFRWNSAECIFAIVELVVILMLIFFMYNIIWGKNGHIINVIRENYRKKE